MRKETKFKCHTLLDEKPFFEQHPLFPDEEIEVGRIFLWAGIIGDVNGRFLIFERFDHSARFFVNLAPTPNKITDDILTKYGWIAYQLQPL